MVHQPQKHLTGDKWTMQEDSLSVSKLFGLIFFFFFHVRIEKLGLYLSIYLSIHPAIHPSIYVSVSELTLHTLAKASKVQTCFASINSNTAGTTEGNDSVLTPAARAALTLEHVDFNE